MFDFAGTCWFLTGPTASGKSALALRLAERLPVEIVAMDSMTLYRGMDIGTAKPSPAERALVPHHLFDLLEPWQPASVAWYVEQAEQVCQQIQERGRVPLFVGGTPLYLKGLLRGLFDGPPADEALRNQLTAEAEQFGVETLHQRLATVDPAAGAKIAATDLRRIVRALEVFQQTGQPISSLQRQFAQPAGNVRAVCLQRPRGGLYTRINARVLAMLDAAWLEEARRLLPHALASAAQAVGYQELMAHLRGELDWAAAITLIQTRTRHFCKHQLTWFRHLEELHHIETHDGDDSTTLVERLATYYSCQTPPAL